MAAFLLSFVVAGAAHAGTFTIDGVEFSDERGGFVLHSVTGSGRADDPFVIVEEITGEGPAILTIRGLSMGFGNRARTSHFVGMAVVKVVINGTDQHWPDFAMELQEFLGLESPYGDGLSFGQGADPVRLPWSDRYKNAAVLDEPRDGVQFAEGAVAPGEQVVFRFTITENSPRREFFLVQQRHLPVAALPGEGAAWASLGAPTTAE